MEGGSGGEVRRVNVVYFLSRDGKVEHPHLIRVHHHHRSGGVRLRDVKRWLSDSRGKDMPDAFAWSYKRRYKTGYVWQDLKDDDLITPVSDNEYVVKGCRIPASPTAVAKYGALYSGEETPSRGELDIEPAEGEAMQATVAKPRAVTLEIEPDDIVSPKPPPRLDQDSPDGPADRTPVRKMDLPSQQALEKKKQENKREASLVGESRSSTSRKASQLFRSILTCRLVETNDSALRPIGQRDRDRLAASGGSGGACTGGGGTGPLLPLHRNANANNSRKTKSTSGGKSSTKAGAKAVPAIYKPAASPNCSQCGKAFRPEKLHSHMKSCKALKGRANGVELKRMPIRTESCSQEFNKEAAPAGLLTH